MRKKSAHFVMILQAETKLSNMIEWKNQENILPLENIPVFLVENDNCEIKDADLGHLITDKFGNVGWYTGDINKVLSLKSRNFWCFVKETELAITISGETSDENLAPAIEHFLIKLRLFEDKFTTLARSMLQSGDGLHPLDYYISGVLNRSMSLIFGFETLLRSLNFLASSHLVRPHLDNFLRLYAAWLVDDPQEFAMKIWQGERIDTLKDRNGHTLKDSYLKKTASKEFPWIENVYNETSGFVHFSNKHISNATSLNNVEERSLVTYIGKYDNQVKNESKLEAIICMIEICNCIVDLVFGYIDTKRINSQDTN